MVGFSGGLPPTGNVGGPSPHFNPQEDRADFKTSCAKIINALQMMDRVLRGGNAKDAMKAWGVVQSDVADLNKLLSKSGNTVPQDIKASVNAWNAGLYHQLKTEVENPHSTPGIVENYIDAAVPSLQSIAKSSWN